MRKVEVMLMLEVWKGAARITLSNVVVSPSVVVRAHLSSSILRDSELT